MIKVQFSPYLLKNTIPFITLTYLFSLGSKPLLKLLGQKYFHYFPPAYVLHFQLPKHSAEIRESPMAASMQNRNPEPSLAHGTDFHTWTCFYDYWNAEHNTTNATTHKGTKK